MWTQKLSAGVEFLAYSPDGRTLYSLDRGRYLIAWDVATRTKREVNYGIYRPIGLWPVADGKRLVAATPSLIVCWDVTNGRELFRRERPERHRYPDPVRVTPDSRVYHVNEQASEIVGWNLATGEPEPPRTVAGVKYIASFEFAPDGRTIVVVARAATAVYDWGDEPVLQNPVALPDASDVRFSPDGRTLALSNSAPPRVSLWDVASRQLRVKNVTGWITDDFFAFNPVYPLFADLNRGYGCTLYSTETGEAVRAFDFALGTNTNGVAFSPDGLTCAVGGSNKQFVVFDVDV